MSFLSFDLVLVFRKALLKEEQEKRQAMLSPTRKRTTPTREKVVRGPEAKRSSQEKQLKAT